MFKTAESPEQILALAQEENVELDPQAVQEISLLTGQTRLLVQLLQSPGHQISREEAMKVCGNNADARVLLTGLINNINKKIKASTRPNTAIIEIQGKIKLVNGSHKRRTTLRQKIMAGKARMEAENENLRKNFPLAIHASASADQFENVIVAIRREYGRPERNKIMTVAHVRAIIEFVSKMINLSGKNKNRAKLLNFRSNLEQIAAKQPDSEQISDKDKMLVLNIRQK